MGCMIGGGVADVPDWVSLSAPVVSEAQDCGLLALVEPGEEAVASKPFSLPPDVLSYFSALRHLALLFWNHTY